MALKLPRLRRELKIVSKEGTPDLSFQQWWDRLATQIESSINNIQAAIDAANLAQAAADTAQAAADAAADAADDAAAVAKLTGSGIDGASPLTATDAGSDATISIASHTRAYSDGTSVSVNSGSVTGLAYSTTYYIYYDDSSFAGGAVTYLSTTDQATATQTGARHLVGGITTPAAAAGDTNGGSPEAPGFGFEIP